MQPQLSSSCPNLPSSKITAISLFLAILTNFLMKFKNLLSTRCPSAQVHSSPLGWAIWEAGACSNMLCDDSRVWDGEKPLSREVLRASPCLRQCPPNLRFCVGSLMEQSWGSRANGLALQGEWGSTRVLPALSTQGN